MDAGSAAYLRFLEGDESGFDEIIRLYHDSLIYFINRYVKSFADAEDLAADTFTELLIHKKRYARQSSFKTYLFSIARHKAIDYVRRERRYSALSQEMLSDQLADLQTVEASVIADDEKRRVRDALTALPSDYAVYIHLCYFEELGGDEIAGIMHKSKKQLANLAYRAKRALREVLEKEEMPL